MIARLLYLVHVLYCWDPVTAERWRRDARIVAGLGAIDTRRFMYGRD